MKKVFIDGSEGTTGLKIFERFCGRDDIEILKIDSTKKLLTHHVLTGQVHMIK